MKDGAHSHGGGSGDSFILILVLALILVISSAAVALTAILHALFMVLIAAIVLASVLLSGGAAWLVWGLPRLEAHHRMRGQELYGRINTRGVHELDVNSPYPELPPAPANWIKECNINRPHTSMDCDGVHISREDT